jgi:hypothetical protein
MRAKYVKKTFKLSNFDCPMHCNAVFGVYCSVATFHFS